MQAYTEICTPLATKQRANVHVQHSHNSIYDHLEWSLHAHMTIKLTQINMHSPVTLIWMDVDAAKCARTHKESKQSNCDVERVRRRRKREENLGV